MARARHRSRRRSRSDEPAWRAAPETVTTPPGPAPAEPVHESPPEAVEPPAEGFEPLSPAAGGPPDATAAPRPDATGAPPPDATGAPQRARNTPRAVLRGLPQRDRIAVVGGTELRLLVLACTEEDTTSVDLASGAMVRLRVPWPDGHLPDLAPFDVVEARLADDPERDDLAQPEALTASTLPRHVGTLRGRRVKRMLARLAAPADGPLLGFTGSSAPYWGFRGARPSAALVIPTRGPQLIRRHEDGSTWVRFGWQRDDVWLPVLDRSAARALDAARRDRLSGKSLATALGFRPHYLLASLSRPRDGHCYKQVTAVLPRG